MVALKQFNKGVLFACLLGISFSSMALTWNDLWLRRDQQGYRALQSGHAKQAAKLFRSKTWRSIAEYRAGNYQQSVKQLQAAQDPLSAYNRGNALARQGAYQQAIDAYNEALRFQADYPDAKHNRDLVKKLLKQQQKKQEKQSQSNPASTKQQPQQAKQQADSSKSGSKQKNKQSKETAKQQAKNNQTPPAKQPKQSSSNSAHASAKQKKEDADRAAKQAAASKQASTKRDATSSQKARDEQAKSTDSPPAQATKTTGVQSSKTKQHDPKVDQWLRQIPDDPGGLLRSKFLRNYQRRHGRQEAIQ